MSSDCASSADTEEPGTCMYVITCCRASEQGPLSMPCLDVNDLNHAMPNLGSAS